MASPPKDTDGNVQPHDDPVAIPDDSLLIRYIPSNWLVPIPHNKRRLSDGAFAGSSRDRDPYQGMSVEVLDLLNRDGIDPLGRFVATFEAVVTLRAGNLRALGFKVGPDPTKTGNRYHASVWGVTRKDRKNILQICSWLRKPPDID